MRVQELCVRTHDADDQAPVEFSYCNPQEKEAYRDFDEADGEQKHWLGNEVQPQSGYEVIRLDVFDVLSSPHVDLRYNDALASNALHNISIVQSF
jgi:hypothetical protein